MHFCEFCGFSSDAKCVKKTRIFPKPGANGQLIRGKICKLCDRKFLVHKDIEDVKKFLFAAKSSLENGLDKLMVKGRSAHDEITLEENKSSETQADVDGLKEQIRRS